MKEVKAGAGAAAPAAAAADAVEDDPWEHWNRLKCLCEHNKKLGVALEITANLPSPARLARWLGEPLRAVILPTEIFLTNKKGYPVLSKRHQAFLLQLFSFKVQVLITGKSRIQDKLMGQIQSLESAVNDAGGNDATGKQMDQVPYAFYVRHLYAQRHRLTLQERYEAPYYDYLQAPLQPLMDNLGMPHCRTAAPFPQHCPAALLHCTLSTALHAAALHAAAHAADFRLLVLLL